MIKNKIQEERMRRYFIDSAKSIIISEGLQALSARTVAEKAGYSYATLYNYFKDIKVMIFTCSVEFSEELFNFCNEETEYESRIKKFVLFFVQYPSLFDLFFLEKNPSMAYFDEVNQMIYSMFGKFVNQDEKKDSEEVKQVMERVVAKLLFYINRRIPKEFSDFMKEIDELLEN